MNDSAVRYRTYLLMILVIFLVSAGMRIAYVLQTPVSSDEFWSVQRSFCGLHCVLDSGELKYNPPIHQFLILPLIGSGLNFGGIRIFFALVGALVAPMLFVAGAKHFNVGAGLAIGVLTAVSAEMVEVTSMVRGFGLYYLFFFAGLYYYLDFLKSPVKQCSLMLFFLFSALAVYSHYFALLFFAVQTVYLVFGKRVRVPMWFIPLSVVALFPACAMILMGAVHRNAEFERNIVFSLLFPIQYVYMAGGVSELTRNWAVSIAGLAPGFAVMYCAIRFRDEDKIVFKRLVFASLISVLVLNLFFSVRGSYAAVLLPCLWLLALARKPEGAGNPESSRRGFFSYALFVLLLAVTCGSLLFNVSELRLRHSEDAAGLKRIRALGIHKAVFTYEQSAIEFSGALLGDASLNCLAPDAFFSRLPRNDSAVNFRTNKDVEMIYVRGKEDYMKFTGKVNEPFAVVLLNRPNFELPVIDVSGCEKQTERAPGSAYMMYVCKPAAGLEPRMNHGY